MISEASKILDSITGMFKRCEAKQDIAAKRATLRIIKKEIKRAKRWATKDGTITEKEAERINKFEELYDQKIMEL